MHVLISRFGFLFKVLVYLTNTIRKPTPGVADENCNKLPITTVKAPEHCPVLQSSVTCGSAWLNPLTAANTILHPTTQGFYPGATTHHPGSYSIPRCAGTRQPGEATAWPQHVRARVPYPGGTTLLSAGRGWGCPSEAGKRRSFPESSHINRAACSQTC